MVEKAETKPDDKPIRVSRAGLIHNAEQEELAEISEISNSKKGGQVVTESLDEVKDKESAAPEAPKPAKPAVKVNPYLLRETTGERTVITKAVFKIGKASRGVDYHIGGNGAISRQHALILKKGDDYYLKMMQAWYFATALAKRYDESISYIENRRLDEWVHKKAIQKAVESCRVTDEHKEYLKSLR